MRFVASRTRPAIVVQAEAGHPLTEWTVEEAREKLMELRRAIRAARQAGNGSGPGSGQR